MNKVVDLDVIRNAKTIAQIVEETFGSEIKRAEKAGCKLMVKIEPWEQVGRGDYFIARVRLTPETNNARTRFMRAGRAAEVEGVTAIEGSAEYVDPSDADEAIKAAIDEAFRMATDTGAIR